jgi:hypothetical protein
MAARFRCAPLVGGALAIAAIAAIVATACSKGGGSSASPSTPEPARLDGAAPSAPAGGTSDVVTWHYDRTRSGVQTHETILTPENVTPASFGRRFAFSVDGEVYAQPLYIAKLAPADGGAPRVVLYVASEHDSVYAFDASGASLDPLWKVSLLGAGETPVHAIDTGATDITPEIGVTGTPVIDRDAGLLYVVAKSARTIDGGVGYVQRLHALALGDGAEKLGGPVEIVAALPSTADDAVGGAIHFDALRHNQRSALALVGGRVWIAWASHGDHGPFHGWLIGYDAAHITDPPLAWATTVNGSAGGIWMAAAGPSSDADGDLYVASGNGTFDGDEHEEDEGDPSAARATNFGSSALRLRVDPSGRTLSVVDSFTPHDQAVLSETDQDFGTIAPIVLPDRPGPSPRRVLSASKSGVVYVLDRDDMGGYRPDRDRVLQTFSVGTGFFISNPVFFRDALYVCPNRTALAAYAIDPATGLFGEEPTSRAGTACLTCFKRGSTPSVSADGDRHGIVWVIDNGAFAGTDPAVLHAYDAADVSRELFASSVHSEDAAGPAVKFTTPVVAAGRVYVGGRGVVTVYGRLDVPRPP